MRTDDYLKRRQQARLTPDGAACAVIYLRVSTGRQAESGLGIEAQEQSCRAFCKRKGITVRSAHADEGLSGSLPIDKRPGLMDALAALQPGDALICYDRSRIGRDVIICAMVDRFADSRGGRVMTADGVTAAEGPAGELIRTILDAVSQFERANAAIRTRMAMAAKKARGEFTGGRTPYGFRKNDEGKLTPDGEEQRVIALVRHWVNVEDMSQRGAARRLNAEGYTTRGGKAFIQAQVRRMLLG